MNWTDIKLEIGVGVAATVALLVTGTTVVGVTPGAVAGFLAYRWPTENRMRFWLIWALIALFLAAWFFLFPPAGEAGVGLGVVLFIGVPTYLIVTAIGRWIGGSVRHKKDVFEAKETA